MADSNKSNEDLTERPPGMYSPARNPQKDSVIESDGSHDGHLKSIALDACVTAITFVDTSGCLTYVNDAFVKMWGYDDPGQVLGKQAVEFWADTKKAETIKKEVENRGSWTGQLVARRKDGSAFDAQSYTSAIHNNKGETIALLGWFVDVTQQNIAENALRRSEARYHALFDNAADLIVVVDTKGNFVELNSRFETESGYKRSEMLGKNAFTCGILTRDSARKTLFYLEQMLAGKPWPIFEIKAVRKDKKLVPYELSAVPITHNGRITSVQAILRNLTERSQAERKLQESQERLRIFTDAAPDAFALFDRNLNLIDINEAALRMFGTDVSKQDVVGKNIVDLYPEAKGLVDFEKYKQVVNAGKPVFIRESGPYPQFGDIYLSIRAFKVGDGLGIAATDITERKKADQALAESEARFRNLMEYIPGISIQGYDTNGTVFYWNKASERVYGYTAEEAMGRNLGDLIIPPDIRPHFEKALEIGERINKSGEFLPAGELMLLHKKGHLVPVYSIHTAVAIQSQKPLLFCIDVDLSERKRVEQQLQKARDELEIRVRERTADLERANEQLRNQIEERERAEKALREAEERFRTIFENTVIGLYRTTPDGKIIMANPALVKMLGYDSFEQLVERNVESTGFEGTDTRSSFKKKLQKKGTIVGQESVWTKADGARLFVCESAVATKDKDGNVLYYEGTVEDITERKKAEEKLLVYQMQLRSLASELSLAEERLRRRIAMDVHDHIGQNLAISKVKLDALRRSLAGSELARELSQVSDMIGRAIQSSRSLTFELSPPVLYELGFEAAVQWLLRNTREQHGIATDFRSDSRPKPLSEDARVLLFQAVRELLINVAKHANANGVKVITRRVADNIKVIVEDDGVGLGAAEQKRRLSTSGGFGLFSIRERLGHIGGTLEIRPGRKVGTRVTMVAPLDRGQLKTTGKGR